MAIQRSCKVLVKLQDGVCDLFWVNVSKDSSVMLGGEGEMASYRQVGARLGLSEAAVKVAAHRLRRRYRDRLRSAVASTVVHSGEVDDELRHLIAALEAS